jgi:dethiobiotin synthetase
MQIFITGTDTDIGKTLISRWLCLHTNYNYFKPIQTGELDSQTIVTEGTIFTESYAFKTPVSPHLASKIENTEIELNKIQLPNSNNLIVEGAGGVMTPINANCLMLDLIKFLDIPVILVASSRLGTINHTLLSLAALRSKDIKVLGVIMSGKLEPENAKAIAFYGQIEVLAQIPFLDEISTKSLSKIALTDSLTQILCQTP